MNREYVEPVSKVGAPGGLCARKRRREGPTVPAAPRAVGCARVPGRRQSLGTLPRPHGHTIAFVEQKEVAVSIERTHRCLSIPLTRRAAVAAGLMLASGALTATSARPAFAVLRQATPVANAPGDRAAAI